MKKLIVAITLAGSLYASAMTTQCPFVDANTGLPCMGMAYPSGMSAAGTIYRCTNGHSWIERD